MWLMNSSAASGATGPPNQDKKGSSILVGDDDNDSSMLLTSAEPEPELDHRLRDKEASKPKGILIHQTGTMFLQTEPEPYGETSEDDDVPPTPTYLEPWEEEEENGEDEQPPTPSYLEHPPAPLLRQRTVDVKDALPLVFRPARHVRWSDELGHELEDVQPEPDPESSTDTPASDQDHAVRDNQELLAGAAVTQSGGFGLLLLLLL